MSGVKCNCLFVIRFEQFSSSSTCSIDPARTWFNQFRPDCIQLSQSGKVEGLTKSETRKPFRLRLAALRPLTSFQLK